MRKFASRAKRGLLVLSPIALAVAMVAAAAPLVRQGRVTCDHESRCSATSGFPRPSCPST